MAKDIYILKRIIFKYGEMCLFAAFNGSEFISHIQHTGAVYGTYLKSLSGCKAAFFNHDDHLACSIIKFTEPGACVISTGAGDPGPICLDKGLVGYLLLTYCFFAYLRYEAISMLYDIIRKAVILEKDSSKYTVLSGYLSCWVLLL